MIEGSTLKKVKEECLKAQAELSRLRAVLTVNFCKYPGSPPNCTFNIWKSRDEIKEKTTYEMAMEAFEFLATKALTDNDISNRPGDKK